VTYTYAYYVKLSCAVDDTRPRVGREIVGKTPVPLPPGQAATDPTPPTVASVYNVLKAEVDKL
jgi:hypothetical protein